MAGVECCSEPDAIGAANVGGADIITVQNVAIVAAM